MEMGINKTQFTVRSCYQFLNFEGVSFAAAKPWSISVPLKIKTKVFKN